MARAMSSLPVPVSPSKSTVESPQATASIICSTRRRPELLPMIPSKPVSKFAGSSIESISGVISGSVLSLRSSYSRGQVRLFKLIALLPFLQFISVSVLFFPPRPRTLSPNPITDVKRTIFERDAIRLAAGKKFNGVLVDERHVPQIQNQLFPRCLRGEQLLQLFDVFYVNPSTKREHDSTVRCSVNFEHAGFLLLKRICEASQLRLQRDPSLAEQNDTRETPVVLPFALRLAAHLREWPASLHT